MYLHNEILYIVTNCSSYHLRYSNYKTFPSSLSLDINKTKKNYSLTIVRSAVFGPTTCEYSEPWHKY